MEKKRNIPIEKQVEFIEEFKSREEDFAEYARLIKKILDAAIRTFGFMGFAEARAKSLLSFANKIIQKDKYKNPIRDVTDLCGARIVVHFERQVKKVGDFIKENFEIDEANSLDLRSRLQVNEFGYRSIHYIVTPRKDEILGIAVDRKFRELKAEIQVRTLAEHIWADISHDRIYKTPLNIPDAWKREAAELSAMLENADRKFAGMAEEIDSLVKIYELQHEKKTVDDDILKFKTLISVLGDNPNELVRTCLSLSALYRASDDFPAALRLLEPLQYLALKNKTLKLKLNFEYGLVKTRSAAADSQSTDYDEGMDLIENTIKEIESISEEERNENTEEISYIYYRAGRLLQNIFQERTKSAALFAKAHTLIPGNPLYLTAMMESLVLMNHQTSGYSIGLFRSELCQAVPKLKELIHIGIERLPALFAIGHIHIFLSNEDECIGEYARAAETIINGRYLISRSSADSEISLVSNLKDTNTSLTREVSLYLNIAMCVASKGALRDKYLKNVNRYRINKNPVKAPVILIAGGASDMDASKVEDYREYLREVMNNFSGTIISGGTTAGIPGLTGEVKAEMNGNFELDSYLPQTLPYNAKKSDHYDNHFTTPSDNFTAFDILVCWADLISNGIDPQDVILIGIDGGRIATLEYKIALSLGAKVALVAYSGRAVSEFVQDRTWKDHPNLLILPNDPLTLWALVNQNAVTDLTPDEIKILAPKVHDFYREDDLKEFKSESEDINKYKVLMPWDNLSDALKASNIRQVSFYEHMLGRAGLSIRKATTPVIYDLEANLSDKVKDDQGHSQFDFLAMLEHARWNAERLLAGWRCGPKDIARKLNPCLVPWTSLDDRTKEYDYKPVRNIPKLLAEIGYEVYENKK